MITPDRYLLILAAIGLGFLLHRALLTLDTAWHRLSQYAADRRRRKPVRVVSSLPRAALRKAWMGERR